MSEQDHVSERVHALRHADIDALRAATARLAPDDAVEACALAAAACDRVLGITLHPNQIHASLMLAAGRAVQLATGEGKTFAAIGPSVLFARAHGSVHVVTANPYLAERDAHWSGRVLEALGLRVGVTLPGRTRGETRAAYEADVVFGAGSDLGFDFLRDRLVREGDPPVQRGRRAAVVDEIDAVLVDGAATPLVLSASVAVDPWAFEEADRVAVVGLLEPALVDVDHLHGRVQLSDAGVDRAEELLGIDNLYAATHVSDWPHLLHNALRAHLLLERDRDYVVRDRGRAIGVIDELTGRVLPGRRWSDGLHQAVEAKEGVTLTSDRRALGSITVGTYFRGYSVLAGMSGTLLGAEAELRTVYGLEVDAVPTNLPMRRVDLPDLRATDEASKYVAVVDDTAARHRRGQPVLVGTTSIAQAASISRLLLDRAVPHRVLSARNDAAEAAIIARAGEPGAVTVATQMAGRGVDVIVDVVEGLMVWGVEHHGTARHDLQLRGRSGRQGHRGASRFAVAPDDPLLDLAATIPEAQAEVESASALARAVSRALDEPIDALHDLVHEWRLQAADPACCRRLLEDATHAVGAHPGGFPVADLEAGLGAAALRRSRPVAARIASCLDERARSLSSARWDAVVSAVLRDVLVTGWSDLLDHLDTDKQLARVSHLFGAHRRRWDAQVEARFTGFRSEVQQAWLLHLLAAEIVVGVPAGQQAAAPAAAMPARAVPSPEDGSEDDVEVPSAFGEWTGPSWNKFWRRHMSLAPPDPPLVLELDAIGDEAPQPVHVRLDHDDPWRSEIWLVSLD